MAIKKVRERVHNGGTTGTDADWDIIHTETSEDMLVGQNQLLGTSGFRVLPGGQIEQWGYVTGVTNAWKTVRFPIKFPNMSEGVWLQEVSNANGCQQTFIQDTYLNHAELFVVKHESTTQRKFYWTAKGF